MAPNSRSQPLVLILGLLVSAAPIRSAQAAPQGGADPGPRESTQRKGRSQKDFDRYLTAGVRLYESLEYEYALEQFNRAKELASSVQEDVLVALYIGVLHADMGQLEQARGNFKTGLLLDPDAQLPLSASPKVVKEFEAMRVRVTRELALQRARAPDGGKPAAPETDRPEREPTPQAPLTPPPASQPSALVVQEVRKAPRLPPVPLALAGTSLVAGGLGTYFGLSSKSQLQSARQSGYADEAAAHVSRAQSRAQTANIFLGTAGLAAAGAVVTWFLLPREAVPSAGPPAATR